MSAKADRERQRKYELREAEAWRKAGWFAQEAWRKAQYIGAGKLITKPQDFFDAFDVMAVHPVGKVAFVQVTETPFVKERDGKADRNAEHGVPPFAFRYNTGLSDPDVWMRSGNIPGEGAELGTVIVSYADPRAPERRWWTRKVA